MRNSYGTLFEYNKNKNYIFKMIGGIIEMKFFLCNRPEECVSLYHNYINRWSLTPFWALGFH